LALTLFIGAAQAQDGGRHHGKGRKGNPEMMAKDLNLTEAQKAQLKQQRESMHAEMKAVQQNGSLTQEQARAQRKAIQEKYKTQMQSILTPEQKAKMENRKGETRNRSARMNEQRFQQIGQELNLTSDQKSKLTAIYANYEAKRSSLQSDNSLSKAQKQAQMKTLMQEHIAQARAILNDDQEKKAEAMLKERKLKVRR
jgi:Spy/CpxP family protein refolding chaperone